MAADKRLTTDDVARAVATLNELRNQGTALVAASRANPEGYLVCAQSAHGKVKHQTPKLWHTARMARAGLDLWGLGYRVVGGVSDYQRMGAIYGFARSYADAQADIEGKARAGVNGRQRIVPGSLYTVPGYLIAKSDKVRLEAALRVAYRAWVNPSSVVGGWPSSTEERPKVPDVVAAVREDKSPVPAAEEVVDWSADAEELEDAWRNLDQLERRVEASQRVEQSILRKALLRDLATGECALCGREMDARLLVAAHIKQRSVCTDGEKRDIPSIAMLNCKFGCDELYEQGFIGVGEDWSMIVSPSLTDETALAYVEEIIQDSIVPRAASASYFAWHREHHALG